MRTRMSLLAGVCLLAGCEPIPRSAGGGGAGGGVWPGPCGVMGDAGTCGRSQPVLTCDVTNARDLGGVPVAASGSVSCGELYRGPPLARLSAQGCQEVARLGIRTVVDLRTPDERLATPDDGCVKANFLLAPLPIPYDVSAANYIADFDATESMVRVFQTLGDSAAYPIYVHCTFGRDRTGVLVAAVLLALGASREDVLREYSLSMATVGAFPASLTALLDEIERRGGIDAALQAAGVSATDLATLRARMVVREMKN